MNIQWLGHSAFKLVESTGTTIITDPYKGEMVGYDMPKGLVADIVSVSHNHDDHNYVGAVEGEYTLLNQEGAFEINGVHITSMQSYHDHHSGSRRGGNLIFKFRMDGVDICHLGDMGEACSIDICSQIGSVDILLIPVGGNYTIDAQSAKEYVDLLMPDVVIPMHYRTRDCDMDIDKVDNFLKLFDEERIIYANDAIDFDRTDFDGEETKIIVFNR